MTETSQDNNLNYILNYIHFYEYQMYWKTKLQERNMPHFKGLAMMNLLKVSKSSVLDSPKKLGHFYVLKNTPAFLFFENLG